MPTARNHLAARLVLAGILAVAYFALYPGDLAALLAPVERILGLSYAVAPGLYAVIGVAILAWAALRIWGRAPQAAAPRESPGQ